jgi:glyoxylase-like metal-dependent hydrolase (beta-lactamase superfamily II)
MTDHATAVVDDAPAVDLGGVLLWPLTDAHGSFTTFREAFPSTAPEQEAFARRRYDGLFRGPKWILPFRAFLIRTRRETVLVDAGLGPPPGDFLPERQGWLLEQLHEVNVEPGEIDLVVLTHLHVDHVGWAAVGGKPMFPRARYLISSPDWHFFGNRPESRRTFAAKLAPLQDAGVLELVEPEVTEIAARISLRPAPGHTPGHLAVEIGGDAKRAIVIADAAVHPLQLHDPSLLYVHDEDPSATAATREALLAELADADVIVAAGHFPGGLGQIATENGSLVWRPVV